MPTDHGESLKNRFHVLHVFYMNNFNFCKKRFGSQILAWGIKTIFCGLSMLLKAIFGVWQSPIFLFKSPVIFETIVFEKPVWFNGFC